MTQLEAISELEEQLKVRLARKSLKYFSLYAYPEHDDQDGLYPERGNKPFHEAWYDKIQYGIYADPVLRILHPRMLTLAPRSSAKTTCIGKKTPIWLLGNDPELRILIVSKTSTLAKTNVRAIKVQIESNPVIRGVFPWLVPSSPWGEESLMVKNSRMDGVPSVSAVGLHGSITGRRADLIIIDDLIDKESVMTDNQREKATAWFDEVVLPVLEPDGRIFAIATRWHLNDIYAKWIESGIWNVEMLPAFTLNEEEEVIIDKETEEPISYWPERWPTPKLLELKGELGSLVFNCQYLNNPSGYEGLIFKGAWLTHYNPLDPNWTVLRKELLVYQGVDPSISESPTANYTAIVTMGVDPRTLDVYLLDVWVDKIDFPKQVKAMREKFEQWHPLKIGVEVVAYQKALERTAYIQGLPVVEVKRATGKLERMIGLSPHFENGRIRLPDPSVVRVPWYDGFVEEYLAFPRGPSPDRLDAFDCAFTVADISGEGSLGAAFLEPRR